MFLAPYRKEALGYGEAVMQGRIDVAYVARLARLELSDEETRMFGEQLGRVLEYVEQMRELDLSGIEPTSHGMSVVNVMREDTVTPGLQREVALANAPVRRENLFLVPKIIE